MIMPQIDLYKLIHTGQGNALFSLIDSRAVDVNTKNKLDETLLHVAIDANNFDIVEGLVVRKANLDVKNFNDYTPLCLAARYGKTEIFNLLLSKGANPDHTRFVNIMYQADFYTAMHIAAAYGHTEIIKSLVAYGVSPNVPTKTMKKRPIDLAGINDQKDTYVYLKSLESSNSTEPTINTLKR